LRQRVVADRDDAAEQPLAGILPAVISIARFSPADRNLIVHQD